MRRSPSIRRGVACRSPMYPTIPHIPDPLLLAERLAAGRHEPFRVLRGRRLGDETNDRLRPRRARVHPAVGPTEAEAITVVDGRLGELATERLVHRGQVGPAGRLRLHDNVARGGLYTLGDPLPGAEQVLQYQGGPRRRIATDMEDGEHHPAIPFPADHR